MQEVLMSREQKEHSKNYWKFWKILNHKTVEIGKIKIQILWDNGEIYWEPLSLIRKDDPVTVAEYAKEKNWQIREAENGPSILIKSNSN